MRIKLNFEPGIISSRYQLCVIAVDLINYRTVFDLIEFIKEKFDIKEKEISLFLDNFYIFPEFKIQEIIKEDEIIMYFSWRSL